MKSLTRSKGECRPTRQNVSHVFFWGCLLSNWCVGCNYSGERAFELLLARLTELGIAQQAPETFSSRLFRSTEFIRGEQWMMAMKGWFFERDIKLSGKGFAKGDNSGEEFDVLKTEMLGPNRPSLSQQKKRALYDSCLCKCLSSKSPKEQKAHGKNCRNFDLKVWDIVSITIVVSSQIARAEADGVMRRLYLQSGNRVFVQASPTDTEWEVGVKWVHVAIEDESKWTGQNRLGIHYGIACKEVIIWWEENLGVRVC